MTTCSEPTKTTELVKWKMATNDSILPGNWLGVFGGGQLGRMFTHAAQRMGYHVAVWEPEPNCPAGQVADMHLQSSDTNSTQPVASTSDDPAIPQQAVEELAKLCRAVTVEFENIQSALLRNAEKYTCVRPSADFLEVCQDRVREKSSLSGAGFPTTPFRAVRNIQDLATARSELGLPLILKTATSGYDGKGQFKLHAEEDIDIAFANLASDHMIAEKCIDFQAEVSMIVARNAGGQMECFPLFENEHANHILDVTRCPVQPAFAHLEKDAIEICRGIADRFDVEGLFCVEFFVDSNSQLLINEIAPRPHNSGHLTIEACNCSQFEQQVRAVCNLPLARPRLLQPAAMANLLGDIWTAGEPRWSSALESSDTHLHLYGKASARPGRKMGHITLLDKDSDAATERVRLIRARLNRS
jgi:5-(carboxyamino)imidazole ribonucleotide synthase